MYPCTNIIHAAEYVIGNISATNEKDLDNYCKCIESRSGGKCEVAPNYYLPVKYTFPTCGGMNTTLYNNYYFYIILLVIKNILASFNSVLDEQPSYKNY